MGATGGVLPDVAGGYNIYLTGGQFAPGSLRTTGNAGYTAAKEARESAWSFSSRLVGSVVIRAKSDRVNNFDTPFGVGDNNSHGPCFFTYWDSSNKFRFGIVSNGTQSSIVSNSIVADYKYHTCVGSVQGNRYYSHIDGVLDKVTTHSLTPQSGFPGNPRIGIGSQIYNGRGFTGNITVALIYSRSIHESGDILSADPLLPFRRRRLRSWFLPSAAGFKPSWWTPPKLIGAF